MVSLLQAHGHPQARHYPVPYLWMETQIVRQRVNRDHATQATLLQLAVASIMSKDGGKLFQKRITALTET